MWVEPASAQACQQDSRYGYIPATTLFPRLQVIEHMHSGHL